MGDINELHDLLQKLHPKIKFTMEHCSKELPFLDIFIKNVNGQIITDIYHKPTDSQHPENCIKSIHYTLARSIHAIITDKNLKNSQKSLKEFSPFQHSEKTEHKELPNAKINDAKYVI